MNIKWRVWAVILVAAATGLFLILYWQSDPSFPATPLTTGRMVAGEPKSGPQFYSVSMQASDFLHLVVDQQGIDVAVEWLDPRGSLIFKVDSPNGRRGPEELWFVAQESAEYRLRIELPEGSALAQPYQVGIRELRPAQSENLEIAEAFAVFMEGEHQRRLGGAEAFHLAEEAYRESLSRWRAAGGAPGQEIICLQRSGQVLDNLGDTRAALYAWKKALTLAQDQGDSWSESILLTDCGRAQRRLGDMRTATAFLRRAKQVSSETGNRFGELRAMNDLAIASRVHGNIDDALALYQQILPLLRAESRPQLDEAELRMFGTVMHNIGVAYSYFGRFEEAFDALKEALRIHRDIGYTSGQADALSAIGWNHYALGDFKAALTVQEDAIRLCREAHLSCPGHLDRLGTTYRSLGKTAKALAAYQESLEIFHEREDVDNEAITLVNLGELSVATGDFEDALEHCRQAFILLDQVKNPNSETHAHYIAAQAEAGLGHLPEARSHIEEALEIVERTRSQTGRQALSRSFLASRYLYYAYYLNLLMGMHEQDPSRNLDVVALEAVERTRARTLLDRLNESQAEARDADDDALLELESRIRAAERLRNQASSPQDKDAGDKDLRDLMMQLDKARIRSHAAADKALREPKTLKLPEMQQLLDEDTLMLTYSLGDPHSYLWVVSRDSMSSYVLPPRQMVERMVNGFHRDIGRAPRAGVLERVSHEASELSRLLLAPVAAQLGKKRLVILGDGALQYLPFAALPSPAAREGDPPGEPLIADHELVGLPSASMLAALRSESERRKPAVCELAVLADPVFQDSDERVRSPVSVAGSVQQAPQGSSSAGSENLRRLPYSGDEARSILGMVKSEEGRFQALGFAATREAALSDKVSRCRIVHFATHAVLDSEFPELSRIVLSLVNEQGQPQDGYLRVHEIYGLKLSADLVVLSACRTALGKDIWGEGLIGLTRGFMYAGVPRMVVSLWSVNDESTQELMTRFYKKMLWEGKPPPAALRAAQLEMLGQEKWRNPYHWAGFVYKGEWIPSS